MKPSMARNAIGLQRFWIITAGMNASMTLLSKLRLSILGYMILAGVMGTVGTAAFRLYVGPAESAVVVNHSEPARG
jgi:hypothetical protein